MQTEMNHKDRELMVSKSNLTYFPLYSITDHAGVCRHKGHTAVVLILDDKSPSKLSSVNASARLFQIGVTHLSKMMHKISIQFISLTEGSLQSEFPPAAP